MMEWLSPEVVFKDLDDTITETEDEMHMLNFDFECDLARFEEV